MHGGLEAPHLTLALPGRLVGDLGTIVRVLVRDMDHRRHHGPARRRVAAQLVADQPAGFAALPFQHFAKESDGRSPIAPRLHEDVDLVTVLIDRPPEILLPSLDVHEQLVQIPRVAHPAASAPERSRIRRADRLLCTRSFNLTVSMIPPACRGRSMTPVGAVEAHQPEQ